MLNKKYVYLILLATIPLNCFALNSFIANKKEILINNDIDKLIKVDEKNNIQNYDYFFLPKNRWNIYLFKTDLFEIINYDTNWYNIITYRILDDKCTLDNGIHTGLGLQKIIEIIGPPLNIITNDFTNNKFLYYGVSYRTSNFRFISEQMYLLENNILKEIYINLIENKLPTNLETIISNMWEHPGSEFFSSLFEFKLDGQYKYIYNSEPQIIRYGEWTLKIEDNYPIININQYDNNVFDGKVLLYKTGVNRYNFNLDGSIYFLPKINYN